MRGVSIFFAACLLVGTAPSIPNNSTDQSHPTVNTFSPDDQPPGQNPWAGWIAWGNGPYKTVSGSWVVPSVTCLPSESSVSSAWIGHDGFISKSVEQIGTQQGCINGTPFYNGWVEFYPALPHTITGPVFPGDIVTASSTWNGDVNFTETITVTDLSDETKDWTSTTTSNRSGADASSVEAIMEAPGGTNFQQPLANFGAIPFTDILANGQPIGNDPLLQKDEIVGASGVQDTATTPIENGTDFIVVWENSD